MSYAIRKQWTCAFAPLVSLRVHTCTLSFFCPGENLVQTVAHVLSVVQSSRMSHRGHQYKWHQVCRYQLRHSKGTTCHRFRDEWMNEGRNKQIFFAFLVKSNTVWSQKTHKYTIKHAYQDLLAGLYKTVCQTDAFYPFFILFWNISIFIKSIYLYITYSFTTFLKHSFLWG